MTGPPLNRSWSPAASPGAYQTWTIASPVATHWRPATCDEIECTAWANGWSTILPAGSDQETLLRHACTGQVDGHRRHFTEQRTGDGLIEFRFAAGQPCFRASEHRTPLERPELYVRRDGDWRAHLGNQHIYDRPDQWVDDHATRLDRLRSQL